jgi:hypothetical protein
MSSFRLTIFATESHPSRLRGLPEKKGTVPWPHPRRTGWTHSQLILDCIYRVKVYHVYEDDSGSSSPACLPAFARFGKRRSLGGRRSPRIAMVKVPRLRFSAVPFDKLMMFLGPGDRSRDISMVWVLLSSLPTLFGLLLTSRSSSRTTSVLAMTHLFSICIQTSDAVL